ncbi:MAG: 3-keto-disaccharide hydrolase, partial [Limisphaerales bacterium]
MRLLNFNARLGGILICIAAGLCASAEEGFIPLFNGQNLDGWDGKPGWWRVEDGAITAESTAEKPCDKHNYLVWRGGEPSDFELRFDYRIVGGNSGVQFRSREIQDWDMRGYQADFEADNEWTGALFEHERGGIALRGQKVLIDSDGTKKVSLVSDPGDLLKGIKTNDWNQYRIIARGVEIQLFINGVRMSHAVDRQKNQAAAKGRIGLQMHPGPPMKVQFRNLRLKEFAPTAAATPADKLTTLPGFKVELLYSPAKEAEGSWVSMCADPKGRLIVSGQYDEGLFRITPSGPDSNA